MKDYKFEVMPFEHGKHLQVNLLSKDGCLVMGRGYIMFAWFFPATRLRILGKQMIKDFEKGPKRRIRADALESRINAELSS